MATFTISQDDLASFHATHFSTSSVSHFSGHFLGPVEEEYFEEEQYDDGLGYYEDGVKRTLTDEQIAIFRHSEAEALLRKQRHAAEEKDYRSVYEIEQAVPTVEGMHAHDVAVEDGEVEDESPTLAPTLTPSRPEQLLTKKEKKIAKAKERGYFKQNIKPDLRKRTWDKVDTGLGSLDYEDDVGHSKSAFAKPARRRKISYED
ncbi:uncharacterized protein RSE6_07457 [Rhynchosporium secalis]|uniref:Uncharacterized protein n=1 Tax=Rhynchosporium secalis TaxID=38038 RepID=A0A1E1MCX1_RHYSE|nr:uncharacterized protein RSE6_07457 [Rhynchosporium secalis]